ncbi:MAG: methyltransferase domain-containing protein [Terriglobales bacterium]|jgi:predicted SAM-dependent methyltransferase
MGKGAALRWFENKLLAQHIRGNGIEIGGLWRRFPAPSNAQVRYVDRMSAEELRRAYSELGAHVLPVDIIADGTRLPFALGSLGFIIASHVLEHLPFPLSALRHWYETLRPGGVLLLKVPDKRYTFDFRRERTPLQHLITEEENPARFNKHAHFADWVEHVAGRRPETSEFDEELRRLLDADYSIHYHAWIDSDIEEMIQFTRTAWDLQWRIRVFLRAHFYRKECALILAREA